MWRNLFEDGMQNGAQTYMDFNFDFEPYYDALHKPYFIVEPILMEFIPFRISTPLIASKHASYLPFMQPEIPLAFILLYFGVCYVGKQRSTRFEHPWFKFAVNVYNAFLVALSAFMVLTIIVETTRLSYTWFNNPVDESVKARPLAKALSIFYLSKYPELLDTVIMGIKGNTRQISFLHIYHHVSIILTMYVVTFTSPYSESYFCALQNCTVHTLMYSYYLLTSMKLGLFFTIAIKKYMTLMQMTQFILNVVQCAYFLYVYYNGKSKGYPVYLCYYLIAYMASLLILFGNFYAKDRKREKVLKRSDSKKFT